MEDKTQKDTPAQEWERAERAKLTEPEWNTPATVIGQLWIQDRNEGRISLDSVYFGSDDSSYVQLTITDVLGARVSCSCHRMDVELREDVEHLSHLRSLLDEALSVALRRKALREQSAE